jgi:hypothetical protein
VCTSTPAFSLHPTTPTPAPCTLVCRPSRVQSPPTPPPSPVQAVAGHVEDGLSLTSTVSRTLTHAQSLSRLRAIARGRLYHSIAALVTRGPGAATVTNTAGYLPLHYLLCNPLVHHEALRAVVAAYPAPVTSPYPARRLYLQERAAKTQFPHRFITPPPVYAEPRWGGGCGGAGCGGGAAAAGSGGSGSEEAGLSAWGAAEWSLRAEVRWSRGGRGGCEAGGGMCDRGVLWAR